MIILNCTNCRAMLEMDEAFAGGVCRCRHCGAIQTVPIHLKHKKIAGGKKEGRTLYSKDPTPDPPPPAAAPATPTPATPPTAAPSSRSLMDRIPFTHKQILIAAIIAAAVLVLVTIIIVAR